MCNVLCHAAATTVAAFPKACVSGCQEQECSPAERVPEAGPPCGCGTATSKLLPEGSHGKKQQQQRRDRRAEPVLPGGRLRAGPAEPSSTLPACFLYFCSLYRLPLLEFLFVFWNSLDLMVLCTLTFNVAQLNVSQSVSLHAQLSWKFQGGRTDASSAGGPALDGGSPAVGPVNL